MTTTQAALKCVEGKIYLIRSQKVMLDSDLAELYGVETKNLNRAVKRNADRFPDDFMFQLTGEELAILRFQFGTSRLQEREHGGRRTLPYAFTQEGVAMLSGVLNSDRAVQVNIVIMRTFVRLRALISEHQELAQKLTELERRYDRQFKSVFDAIRALMSTQAVPMKRIIGLGPRTKE